ncbi:MAG: alpha/beta hydrolase fold protein [Solirubrobacterales bacterium]|nr:alpha/beta hydrolase fold protein [Solirubrobacterales bacterium]
MSARAGGVPMPQLEGVSHRDVEAAGIRFHVAEAGAGDPVVLLHGWPQHWYCWRKVIPLLADGHRVICPDLRGFGWSDAPAGAYDKQTLADDVVAILDALELERVDLLAHDWGAWIGFILALDHPDRIAHYVALNIYPPWAEPPSAGGLLGLWRILYQLAIATPGIGSALIRRTDFVKRLIRAGAVHKDAWSAEVLETFSAVLREPARADATVHLYRTFLLRELRPYLAGANRSRRLHVPTLLLHGMRDLAVDYRRLGEWEAHADQMAVELREDSGHFIAEELPDFVAARAQALFAGGTPAEVTASPPPGRG